VATPEVIAYHYDRHMTTPTLATIERGSFAGHETFPLRYAWLRKAVQHVGKDPRIFLDDDAMVRLGVGKNMVRSIRHWGLVCGVIEENTDVANNRGRALRPTALGRVLFDDEGWDPYLEDPATLWLLHYQLASVPDHATTWYLVFNHLPQPEFTRPELLNWLLKLVQERSWGRLSPASLKRDVDVFLRTYVPSRASRTVPLEDTLDSPFVELELLRELGARGSYVIQRGDPPSLPDAVFAYGLVSFLTRNASTSKAVPLHTIAFAPGSPGRVFALTEDALMARLERIEAATDGAVVFNDTAGLRQLFVHRLPGLLDVLRPWYEGRDARERRMPDA
jgi:Protein of unknown function (DUF4007)